MGEHIVQLFDGPGSLADAVTRFLLDGAALGDRLLLAIGSAHWEQVSERLADAGYDLAAALRDGRLLVLDAASVLRRLIRRDRPDPGIFEEVIGQVVRQLAGQGGLRVYGELVDLLAAEGNFRGAQAIEALWNQLAERHQFTLFCGYSAVHFGDPRTAGALQSICRLHTQVRANPVDDLSAWLLRNEGDPLTSTSPA